MSIKSRMDRREEAIQNNETPPSMAFLNSHWHGWRRYLRVIRTISIHLWPGIVRDIVAARLRARRFDRLHGITTSLLVEPESLRMEEAARRCAMRHQPVDDMLFHSILRAHPEIADQTWFVDLGAGLGKAMMLAAGYPFTRLVGVELDANLCQGLRRNLALFGAHTVSMPEWELREGDAQEYWFPNHPLLILLSNPFTGEVLARVLDNLARRVAGSAEEVWLLYINPVEASAVPKGYFEAVDGHDGLPFSGRSGWRLYRGRRKNTFFQGGESAHQTS